MASFARVLVSPDAPGSDWFIIGILCHMIRHLSSYWLSLAGYMPWHLFSKWCTSIGFGWHSIILVHGGVVVRQSQVFRHLAGCLSRFKVLGDVSYIPCSLWCLLGGIWLPWLLLSPPGSSFYRWWRWERWHILVMMEVLHSSKLYLMVKEVSGVCHDQILALDWLTISAGVCSVLYGCAQALHPVWVWHSSSVILV